VNRGVDKARELTLRFKEKLSLELLDRKTAKWRTLEMDRSGEQSAVRLTLAPGDGELLRVNPGR
jgi:hypothetical protein